MLSSRLNSLGTHFDEIAVGSLINVTIQEGKTAYFDCKINLLQDKTVSPVHGADIAINSSQKSLYPHRSIIAWTIYYR